MRRAALVLTLVVASSASARLRADQGVGPAPAPQATPPANTTAMILGQVVDASSGRPIPDAIVTLNMRALAAANAQASAARAGVPPPAPTPPPAAMTSGDGRFLFHDLPQGPAQLMVSAPGYVNGSAGQSRPNGPSRPLELAEGERLTGVVVKLWKYASLSGTVIDEAGEPAVATQVQALRRTEAAGRTIYSQSGTATTDDRGQFRLSQLVPGDYIVMLPQTQITMPASVNESLIRSIASGAPGGEALLDLVASGGPQLIGQGGMRVDDLFYSTNSTRGPAPQSDGKLSVYPTIYYPSATSAAAASPVSVKSGEDRAGVDLQLRLVPGVRVSGVVTGPEGPVSNVGVRLVPASPDGPPLNTEQTATSSTRADGTFMFVGVPAGQYLVRVNKEPRMVLPAAALSPFTQMAFGSAASTPPTGVAAMALYAAVPLTVGGADVNGVPVALALGAKLSGRIVFQGTAARPDLSATRLNVSVTPVEGNLGALAAGAPTPPDASGAFTTRGYPPGRYSISVVGSPGPAWMVSSITIGGRDVLDTGFELKDTDLTDLVVTYSDKIGQISGTARASSGAATTTATLVIVPAGYSPGSVASPISPRRARTVQAQKTGSYTVNNVGPGDYVIAAFSDADAGDLQDAAFIASVLRLGTHVSVTEGEKKAIDLTIVRPR